MQHQSYLTKRRLPRSEVTDSETDNIYMFTGNNKLVSNWISTCCSEKCSGLLLLLQQQKWATSSSSSNIIREPQFVLLGV